MDRASAKMQAAGLSHSRPDPPTAKAARAPEMKWWSPGELRQFLASVADDELFALWRTVALSGMRRGEACGLRWSELDQEVSRRLGHASVAFTLDRYGHLMPEAVPKRRLR